MFTQYTNSHCFATLKMFQSMTMWFGGKALEGKIIFKYSFEDRCLRVRAWKCVFFKFKLLRVRVKLSPLPKILATNTSPKIAIEKLLTVFFSYFFQCYIKNKSLEIHFRASKCIFYVVLFFHEHLHTVPKTKAPSRHTSRGQRLSTDCSFIEFPYSLLQLDFAQLFSEKQLVLTRKFAPHHPRVCVSNCGGGAFFLGLAGWI